MESKTMNVNNIDVNPYGVAFFVYDPNATDLEAQRAVVIQQPQLFAIGQPPLQQDQPQDQQQDPQQQRRPKPRSPLQASLRPAPRGVVQYVNACEANVRRDFVRKVYIILAIQLIVTLGVILVAQYVDAVRDWFQDSDAAVALVWVALMATFCLLCCTVCNPGLVLHYPGNLILLALITVALTYMLAFITAFYDTEIVLQAIVITAIVVVALTIFTIVTKFDFSGLGPILCGATTALIFAFFMRLFFPSSPVVDTVFAGIAAVLFSLYLVYDTYMIMNELPPDLYVFAVLRLYMDIITLFLLILAIIGMWSR